MSLIQAISVVKNNITEGCKILEDEILENEVAWFIPYIDTLQTEVFGGSHSGFLVDKHSFELHMLGSGLSIEAWLEGYKIGIRFKVYELLITKINDKTATLKYLNDLHFRYYKVEEEGGTIWRIGRKFSEKMIKERIASIPCRFSNQIFDLSIQTFMEIIASKAFEYELIETVIHERLGSGELFS